MLKGLEVGGFGGFIGAGLKGFKVALGFTAEVKGLMGLKVVSGSVGPEALRLSV